MRHYYSIGGVLGVLLFLFAKISRTKPLFRQKLPWIEHPLYIRIGTTDASVLKQVFLERQYDYPLPISPKVIVDAGANIGLSAIFFANRYPDALILAIEPEDSNFQLLQRNTAPYPKIRPLKVALWQKNQQIRLIDPRDGNDGFQTKEGLMDNDVCLGYVRGVTLDAIMAEKALSFIDVLKIDIEGAEKEVFENSSNWINRVGIIIAELHDHIKSGCSAAFLHATQDFDFDGPTRGETIIRIRNELVV
jgi:FkbM family methyltransferase